MGRALFLLIFFIAFVIFITIKVAGSAVKTAYHDVFKAEGEAQKALEADVQKLIAQFLTIRFVSTEHQQRELQQLLGATKAVARRRGFELQPSAVKDLLATGFASAGIGPDYKVRTMLDMV